MQILRASEDYLETMLMMQQQHGCIRSIDVAEHLGVTKPSVTYATKRPVSSTHLDVYKRQRRTSSLLFTGSWDQSISQKRSSLSKIFGVSTGFSSLRCV